MQKHDPASPSLQRAIVISPNPVVVRQLEPLFAAHFRGTPVTHLSKYPASGGAAQAIGEGASQLLFLDVSGFGPSASPDLALQLLTELCQLGEGTQVLALLSSDNPDFILRCLRAGAADFLVQPFTGDQFEAVVAKLDRNKAPGAALGGNARIVAVMPAKGACGATTLAVSLAYFWKRMGAKRVLLADLDALTGTVSFLLKSKPSRSFVDVLQRASELDDDLWRSSTSNINGVDVLFAPENVTDGAGEMSNPLPILNYARNHYDVVILDTNGVYGPWNLNQARVATDILLVATNELSTLQATQRALSFLDTSQIPSEKIRLVVNRYRKEVGLNREVIGTALHTEIYESLPSDVDGVQKALMEGKPVQASTPFGKALTELTKRLAGPLPAEPEKAKKAGGFGGLLSLFSRPSK